jgi:hypothetical protein
MITIHVKGCVGSLERVRDVNSGRTWMEGATMYWDDSIGGGERTAGVGSRGSSAEGSNVCIVAAERFRDVDASRPG